MTDYVQKRTSAPPKIVDGVTFLCWKTGILMTQWRSEDDRIKIGDNGHHRSTYWAMLDGKPLTGAGGKSKRFQTQIAAMRAAAKLSKKAPAP